MGSITQRKPTLLIILVSLALCAEILVLLQQLRIITIILPWERRTGNDTVVAEVIQKRQQLNSRGSGSLTWYPMAQGDKIHAQDSVMTGPSSWAKIKLNDGTEIELDSETFLSFTNEQSESKTSVFSLEMDQGVVRVKSTDKPIDVKVGKRRIKLDSKSEISISSVPLTEIHRVEVKSGLVHVGDRDYVDILPSSLKLKPGEALEETALKKNVVQYQPIQPLLPQPPEIARFQSNLSPLPPPPEIGNVQIVQKIVPLGSAIPLAKPHTLTAEDFQKMDKQKPFTVAKKSDGFSNIPLEKPLALPQEPVLGKQIPNAAVTAKADSVEQIAPAPKALQAPKIKLLPRPRGESSRILAHKYLFRKGRKLATAKEKVKNSASVLFEWRLVKNAANYHFEISKSEKFTNLIFSLDIMNTSLNLELESPGDYFWRVAAKEPSGRLGNWSKVGTVSLEQLPDPEEEKMP